MFLPAPKSRTVYNGVEIERFEGIPRTVYDRFTIAFVGQLIPEKGVKTLIQASQELARDQNTPPFQLMIAGAGWQRDALERYCIDNDLDHVHFLGQIDWAPGLMSSADVVVVPSEWEEACAFTILEAMACGACLVVSDAGGNRELIGEHLNAGLVFRKGDVHDMARHLSTLMRDAPRRKQLAAAAKERARGMFSMQRMVQEHAREYSNI